MPRPDYGFNTRDVARESSRGGFWILIVGVTTVVVVFVLAWFVFGLNTALAPTKGKGDAFRTKESGPNRIAAQERFEQMYADIKAADRRIDTMAAAVKAQPHSPIAQTNLTGSITYCQQAVADYNAEARKYSARDFRAADLPVQIDDLDPSTDCKETSQ